MIHVLLADSGYSPVTGYYFSEISQENKTSVNLYLLFIIWGLEPSKRDS